VTKRKEKIRLRKSRLGGEETEGKKVRKKRSPILWGKLFDRLGGQEDGEGKPLNRRGWGERTGMGTGSLKEVEEEAQNENEEQRKKACAKVNKAYVKEGEGKETKKGPRKAAH